MKFLTIHFLLISGLTISSLGQVFDRADPGPRIPLNETEIVRSNASDWECSFNFSRGNESIFTESLTPSFSARNRTNFGLDHDNQITTFNWNGTSCYCWVLLYQRNNYRGEQLGLWIGATNGTYDLTNFVIEDSDDSSTSDTDDIDDVWIQWDSLTSSYRIFCF